ncbi:MAG: hypothetical protein QF664_09055 [Dehalococcoidia bacterium]|jgi:hypothetical protein|nr:hypothetical protein [Dehalococcoidia bacterium]
MRRLLFIGLTAALGVAFVRRLTAPRLWGLMETMMEHAMPHMMDACFAQMSPDRRQWMLAHCRGLLDQMAEKYEGEAG